VARVDRRRAQREARHARARGTRRGRGGSRTTSARTVEHTLFFTRLRRQAKWAFAVMVIVFGVGFAFLGVGSGGLDLQSLVTSVFGSKGGGGTSISKAQAGVKKHPSDPHAYKVLADAYQNKGRTSDAITTLEHYVTLRPKDATQLQRLALLELQQTTTAAQAYSAAQQNASSLSSPPSLPTQIGGNDPIVNGVQSQVSTQAQQTFTTYQTDAKRAIHTLKRLALVKNDVSSYTQYATAATQFGYPKDAVKAYKVLLKLEPDPRTKAQIRARIKSLKAAGG
jgi:hypothetical protein